MHIVSYSRQKHMEWFDNAVEMLFEHIAPCRVVGGAAFVTGIANVVDTRTGAAAILIDTYHLPLPIHIAFMVLLAVSGVVLMLSKQPQRAWFLPMALFTVTVPIASLATNLLFGIKTLASFGLLTYYIVRTARREAA